ncbi:ATP-dependent zinc metalloprotease FtsH [Verrucomicrobiales bacterium BCK34]|nr:ATP-dependent zinc metalloprotease FtsH [Verrucomicrobiales bacterium BCK34]
MQEQEPNKEPQRQGGGENGFNWKGLILLFIAMSLFALAIWSKSFSDASRNLTYAEFEEMVKAGKIQVDPKAEPARLLRLVQKDGSAKQYLTGWYEVENPGENGGNKYSEFTTPVILEYVGDDLKALLAENDLQISDLPTDSDGVGMMMMSFYMPVFFLLILLYFLFRHQIKAAGKGAMSFGKSKAKLMSMDKGKVTFKDVAGIEEAKEEVWEIVEYLRDPKKFQKLGGRIPKGVLMVGSPGTGKTLLARAIAGEADVPFFSISGSDFVEMFVGVGASRVRDMFEQGKKSAPCLIFIDEIDAVGRHRGHGMGGGHDEREQTLNALLVEMDGFDTQEGVIIIAATNRPDVLDPALLRPGRFDREIRVGLPDVKGREEILRVHAKKVKLAEGVDLGVIARGTPGYSGAELANVINESALLAASKGLKAITLAEMEEARDKVRWGKERRSLALSDKEKENTAYHEAGHAILNELLEHTDPLHKVTIIPRGPALGVTMFLPLEDKYTHRKYELLDDLVVAMGGRVAEEIIFGDVTNGASGDIRQASNIARKMVCSWGMSDDLGMVEYGESQEPVFVARDIGSQRTYSEATAQKIDDEVKRLIDEAYAKATKLINENRDKLEAIAQALLLYETINGSHVKEIMEHGDIQNPPDVPTPPDLPAEPEVAPSAAEEKKDHGGEDFSGELAPA